MTVKLGVTATDRITGFSGVVTGYCEYISGCNQALLIPKVGADGAHREGQWYDVQRLDVDPNIKAVVLDNGPTPGFDNPGPAFASARLQPRRPPMRTIWKYEIPVDDAGTKLELPNTAKVIHVALKPDTIDALNFWVEFDPADIEPKSRNRSVRLFQVFGTGHTIREAPDTPPVLRWQHCGSAITAPDQFGNPLVWHLYERFIL
jgi:hypothetical protein